MDKLILLVDDEHDFAVTCSKRLTHAGYGVISAASGAVAIDMLHRQTPDLILLDMHMPNMSGMEVCNNLKKDSALRNIPVIFITADSTEIESKVKVCGAQDYILKPYATKEFLDKIDKYLNPSPQTPQHLSR